MLKPHAPTAAEIMLARRLTREGKLAADITEALGWGCSDSTTVSRFARLGLKLTRGRGRKAHEGAETHLPDRDDPFKRLSAAEARALTAVEGGEVVRVLRARGNVLKGPRDVTSSTLWRLDKRKLIADGTHTLHSAIMETRCVQVVTNEGQKELARWKARKRRGPPANR